jgi:hypothetical protein
LREEDTMDTTYPHWSISSGSQAAAEITFGSLTLVALVFCVWLARRERQIWPLMVWLGGAVMALYEPLNNILAHVAYPEEGQHTVFSLFGRDMPGYLVLVYMCYFGLAVPLLMKQFEKGVTPRRCLAFYAVLCCFAMAFEPIPIALDWWTYYGDNQPLEVLGLPLWWVFADAAVVLGTATLFSLAQRHILTSDWQSVVFVPGTMAAVIVWHATAAFPTYAAISGGASEATTTAMSLLTITIAITWAFLMARIVAVTQVAPAPAVSSSRAKEEAMVPAGVGGAQ